MGFGSEVGRSYSRNLDPTGRRRRSSRKSRAASRMNMGSMVVPITRREKKRQDVRNKKDEKLRSLFNQWRYWDSFGALFANFSLLIAIVYYEIDISYMENHLPKEFIDLNSGKPAMESFRFLLPYAFYFRMSILATSGLAIFCFVMRESFRRSWMKSFLPSINEN